MNLEITDEDFRSAELVAYRKLGRLLTEDERRELRGALVAHREQATVVTRSQRVEVSAKETRGYGRGPDPLRPYMRTICDALWACGRDLSVWERTRVLTELARYFEGKGFSLRELDARVRAWAQRQQLRGWLRDARIIELMQSDWDIAVQQREIGRLERGEVVADESEDASYDTAEQREDRERAETTERVRLREEEIMDRADRALWRGDDAEYKRLRATVPGTAEWVAVKLTINTVGAR